MMKKLASTSTLSHLAAAMCIVLACCSTEENVPMVVNPEETVFLGKWTTTQSTISFPGFKDPLVEWGVLPEQEVDAMLESWESELIPEFVGNIIFKSDGTYTTSLGVVPSNGKWNFNDNTLTVDAGFGRTVLTVTSISSSTLEAIHSHQILKDVGDNPFLQDVAITVATTITLTK